MVELQQLLQSLCLLMVLSLNVVDLDWLDDGGDE